MRTFTFACLGLIAFCTMLLAVPSFAWANPETFYELPPEGGKVRVEYNGQIGSTKYEARAHSLEAFVGLNDAVALGLEVESVVEGGHMVVEKYGVGVLTRFTDHHAPLQVGALVKAAVTRHGDFPQAEGRLIANYHMHDWSLEGNAIVRHHDEKYRYTEVAYAAAVLHEVAPHWMLGVESSGQVAQIAGNHKFHDGYFAGPTLRHHAKIGKGGELGFGIGYLHRIGGDHSALSTVRINIGLTF